jgi:hypothetical protein
MSFNKTATGFKRDLGSADWSFKNLLKTFNQIWTGTKI